MAFLAPIIGAAAGLSAIGSSLLSGAVAFGLSTLARQLAPEPADHSRGSRGMRLSLRLESNAEREAAFGTVATAGSLVYHNTYGPNGNDTVQLVYALADHQCDGLVGLEVDGVPRAIGTDGSVDSYDGKMVVEFHDGAWDQDADGALVFHAPSGGWSENERGRGVCYVRVSMTFSPDVYKSGLPHFLFIIRGLRLYDPRLDSTVGGSGAQRYDTPATWQWTDNPAVCLYNFRRGIVVGGSRLVGLYQPATLLPLDAWFAAMNACDESVARKDGSPEARYRLGGMVSTASDNRSIVREMLSAMAGIEVDTGGVVKCIAGVARTPVLNVTDADLMSDGDVEITPRLSRAELANAIYGSIHDPAQHFESVALPPRISSADIASDGVELQKHFALDYVPSPTQGQRILEIYRRRERYQRRVSAVFRARCAVLEAGDWVSWTSARYGFIAQTFEVITAQLRGDMTVALTLRDIDASVYEWAANTDEIDTDDPQDLASGGATFQQVAGLAVATVSIDAAGATRRPGLQATWTPVSDVTTTALEVEYRIVGDTVPLSLSIFSPGSGAYTWVTGIQGGVAYEVRMRPVTNPARAVSWTGWVSSTLVTDPVVVTAAEASAPDIADGSITPEMLSPEARRQLEIATTVSATLDGLAADVADRSAVEQQAEAAIRAFLTGRQAQTTATAEALHAPDVSDIDEIAGLLNAQKRVAEETAAEMIRQKLAGHQNTAAVFTEETIRTQENRAFAQQLVALLASIDDANASITDLSQVVADGDSALAQRVTTVETSVDGNSASIQQITQSIDGIGARWTLQVVQDGTVTGAISLDGADELSAFRIQADRFEVSLPGVSGGAPVPVFAIAEVDGVTKLAFRGDMYADGTIKANHIDVTSLDAIAAALGTITTGRIQSEDGLSFIDLRPGQVRLRMVA